jgi:hypothetical protein
MSDELSKMKHSKRLYKDEVKSKKQYEIVKNYGLKPENDIHRYHKQRAMNCGNPNCVMCANPRKVFKEKTIQEKKFDSISREEY